MDKSFKEKGNMISSRAVAVTAYLFAEELYVNKKISLIPNFARFFFALLEEINNNMELLSKYEKPANSIVMDEFQKYILQASVEGYSIKRRHDFIKKAFGFYRDKKKIIGGK